MFVIELTSRLPLSEIDAHMASHMVYLEEIPRRQATFWCRVANCRGTGEPFSPSASTGSRLKPSRRKTRSISTDSPTSGSLSFARASARTISRSDPIATSLALVAYLPSLPVHCLTVRTAVGPRITSCGASLESPVRGGTLSGASSRFLDHQYLIDGDVLQGLLHPARPTDLDPLNDLRRAQADMQADVVAAEVAGDVVDFPAPDGPPRSAPRRWRRDRSALLLLPCARIDDPVASRRALIPQQHRRADRRWRSRRPGARRCRSPRPPVRGRRARPAAPVPLCGGHIPEPAAARFRTAESFCAYESLG